MRKPPLAEPSKDHDLPGCPLSSEHRLAHWFVSTEATLLLYIRDLAQQTLEGARDPEDILQDCFHAAWTNKKASQIESEAGFIRWMRVVIRNRIYELRRRRSQRGIMLPTGCAEAEWMFNSAEAPMGGSAAPGLPSTMDTTYPLEQLRHLPEEEHLVLVLRDKLKLEWKLVAKVLKRTVEAAKSLRQRALKRLA